ncbi:MAG TPA: heme peroxidase family protein [Actinomycetota bacterium]|nr:heme peroxidase family protein [Actinomycetota bacterium]
MGHADEPRGLAATPRSFSTEGRFGRLFRTLPPFRPPDRLLIELGSPGGAMEESRGRLDNPDVAAGFTYLGQFVDHDITFDPVSSFDRRNDPDALVDFRTPRFDLDSVYGSGPAVSPHLYDRNDPDKLLVGRNDAGDLDLPRNRQQTALVGDPRNDENVLVSQMHVAFLKFHNALVEALRDDGEFRRREKLPGESTFATAQRLARWHYQWLVVDDFLPAITGRDAVDAILDRSTEPWTIDTEFYDPVDTAFIPVEFSVAAYRFGHSMIRPVYDLNAGITDVGIFGRRDQPLSHLGGNRELPAGWQIEWPLFFKFPRRTPQASRKIDARIAAPLMNLPDTVVPAPERADHPERKSLAVRNLLRGKALGLPSGQAVASRMGATPIPNADLGLDDAGWDEGAPLWFYVLKEAGAAGGARLGDVGGRIVCEVLLGILDVDRSSFVHRTPAWEPRPPVARRAGGFGLVDFLRFAGVA